MMNFVSKMMQSAFKMMKFVPNMMNIEGGGGDL